MMRFTVIFPSVTVSHQCLQQQRQLKNCGYTMTENHQFRSAMGGKLKSAYLLYTALSNRNVLLMINMYILH